jgi:hypothetical protein
MIDGRVCEGVHVGAAADADADADAGAGADAMTGGGQSCELLEAGTDVLCRPLLIAVGDDSAAHDRDYTASVSSRDSTTRASGEVLSPLWLELIPRCWKHSLAASSHSVLASILAVEALHFRRAM